MTTASPEHPTLLAAVLAAHGTYCGCTGACGRDHLGGMCRAGIDKPVRLHAAPYPPPLTDRESVTAPVSALRPWCGQCWRKALTRERETAAERRRIELAEAQLLLFDASALTAPGKDSR